MTRFFINSMDCIWSTKLAQKGKPLRMQTPAIRKALIRVARPIGTAKGRRRVRAGPRESSGRHAGALYATVKWLCKHPVCWHRT
jgi:hypothetical protein